jgi:hypothetical protein
VALAILQFAVAPVIAAGQGAIRLSAARVSPTTVTEGSPVSFEVRYRNLDGVAPDRVWVEVAGNSYTMHGAGSAWDRSVKFSVKVSSLKAGTFQATFNASAGSDRAKIKAGTVTVKPGSGSGSGSGGSTSGGSGSGSGGSTSGGSGSGSGGSGSGDSSGSGSGSTDAGGSTTGGVADGASGTGSSGAAVAMGSERTSGVGGWTDDGWVLPDATATGDARTVESIGEWGDPTVDAGHGAAVDGGVAGVVAGPPVPLGGSVPDGSGSNARGQGRPWLTGLAAAGSWLPPELVGLDDFGLTPMQRLLSVTMTTTGVVVVAFAFGFLAKRRRDGDPTAAEEVLQANASRASSFATASLVPSPVAGGAGPSWPAPDVDPDSHLPRWRRPSLMEARKADPLKQERVHMALAFADSAAGGAGGPVVGGIDALDGLERRRIRYRLVRLLESPDELRAAEIGYLDEGDEVQLVSQQGAYWLVLCPDGQQGWIHRMTLGEVIRPEPRPGRSGGNGSAHDDVDPDVLAAFAASQRAS